MNSQFQLSCLCGKCFRPVSSSTGGYILSCTDLLCVQCSNNGNITSCPACGKQNIQALNLKEPLPDEVSASISDPVIKLESIINTTKFQIKYYKQTLKKLLSTVSQLAKENQQLKSIISQQRNGADTSVHSAGSSFFQEPQLVAPRASMNQLLSSPVDLASMPPSAAASVAILRPQTSLSVQATGSLLAKRSNTSLRHMNDTNERQPPTQSPHFTTNPGSWKRSATSDCPFSAMPAATDSAVSSSSTRPAGTDTVQWGFGLPAEHAGGTIPVRSPNSYGPGSSGQARNAGNSQMRGGSSERPYTARKPPTPASIARPFSAVPRSPPPFVTPSRLRSPHLSVARGAQSGGSSARSTAGQRAMETSRTAAANPWQGRSVTLSQSGNASSEYDKAVQLQQQQEMSQSSSSGGNHLDNFVRASTGGIH